MTLDMNFFEELRNKINLKLIELVRAGKYDKEFAKEQIEKYSWVYGALGKVPSDVMFICENPSKKGIEKAHEDTIDGGLPDIEAQWWGGSTDFAACRFRPALCRLKLKTTRARMRGGWECYITNVIKQSNVAVVQEHLPPATKKQQAMDWSEILQWEYYHVKPKYVFCVGDNSFDFVHMLQKEEFLSSFPINKIRHYSDRGYTDEIINNIVSGVQDVMSKSEMKSM